MKINEVAKLTGVTVRALHHYDKIGLLKPMKVTESGYRIYGEKELETLQQILFFRELDFSLNEIKEIMQNPSYDKTEALRKQKELLLQKRERLDGLITLVERTLKGNNTMSFKEFDMTEIEENTKKYADEVKKRWGNTEAYAQSKKKTEGYTKEQWENVGENMETLLEEFAKKKNLLPDSEEVQELVKKWQDHITENFYTCSKEMLSGLGIMYIADERFTENIDKHGAGTAAFMAKAIEVYCQK